MKKLLLSTLILNLGLIGSINTMHLRGRRVESAVPAAAVNPVNTNISEKIKTLQQNIKKNNDPISIKLQTLNKNIGDLTTELNSVNVETLDIQSKNDVNELLRSLEQEANELWEKFGGSTFRWMYPTYQTTDLKNIKTALDNIKDLNEKVNPMNIVTRYAYNKVNEVASFINKNKAASLLGAWTVYRLSKGAYSLGFYPSSASLAKVAGLAKWAIIG